MPTPLDGTRSLSQIISRFDPLIKSCSHGLPIHEREDLEQELRIQLLLLVRRLADKKEIGRFVFDELKSEPEAFESELRYVSICGLESNGTGPVTSRPQLSRGCASPRVKRIFEIP